MPGDQLPMDLNTGFFDTNREQMGRMCIRRHGKAVNVSFFDGHAENVRLQKLWTLDWNREWHAPNPLPRVP